MNHIFLDGKDQVGSSLPSPTKWLLGELVGGQSSINIDNFGFSKIAVSLILSSVKWRSDHTKVTFKTSFISNSISPWAQIAA